MEIIVVWPYELETPNRAPYQRIKALSNHFNVCIISMMKNKIDNQIRKKINRIISVDININQRIKYILYLFKMIVTLFSYSFNKKQVSIYMIYNWTILPVMIISIIFGIKIFVDFLDDPYLMEQVYKIKKDSKIKYYIYKFINILFERFALNDKYISGFCSIGMNKSSMLPTIFSKRYKIQPNKLIVLPNGADLSISFPNTERKNNKILHIVYVTLIGPQREVDIFINILSKIKNVRFKLILIGETITDFDKKWINNLVKDRNWIEFRGKLPHNKVLEWIGKSDVGIFMASKKITNYRYTHSIKVPEYLAMGLPVIAPRFEGVMDIVEDGYNGFLFEPDHPEDIIDIITKNKATFINRELLLNSLHSIKQFDWNIINDKFISEFRRTLIY